MDRQWIMVILRIVRGGHFSKKTSVKRHLLVSLGLTSPWVIHVHHWSQQQNLYNPCIQYLGLSRSNPPGGWIILTTEKGLVFSICILDDPIHSPESTVISTFFCWKGCLTVCSLFLRNGFWQISPQREVIASWGFHHWT